MTKGRAFWTFYWLVIAIALVGYLAGAQIELLVAPFPADQVTTDVVRYRDRICFTSTFVKTRTGASPNMDAFLTVNGQPNGGTYFYDEPSGHPWGMTKYAVPARTEPYSFRSCSPLPPYLAGSDTIRNRSLGFYPGFLGLWWVQQPFPDVVDRGER